MYNFQTLSKRIDYDRPQYRQVSQVRNSHIAVADITSCLYVTQRSYVYFTDCRPQRRDFSRPHPILAGYILNSQAEPHSHIGTDIYPRTISDSDNYANTLS